MLKCQVFQQFVKSKLNQGRLKIKYEKKNPLTAQSKLDISHSI